MRQQGQAVNGHTPAYRSQVIDGLADAERPRLRRKDIGTLLKSLQALRVVQCVEVGLALPKAITDIEEAII